MKKDICSANECYNLAIQNMHKHNLITAQKFFYQTIQLNPNHFQALYNLATIFGQNNCLHSAKKYFQQSLQNKEFNIKCWLNLAIVCVELEDWQAVITNAQHYIDAVPKSIKAYLLLGFAYLKSEQYEKAEEYYLRVMQLDSDNMQAKYHLALIYTLQSKNTLALQQLNNQRDIDLDNFTANDCYNLAVIYHKSFQYDKAELCYLNCLLKDKDNFLANYNLASLYHKQQKIPAAIKYYKIALQLRPNAIDISYILSALSGENLKQAPLAYIEKLFDHYANTFEQELQVLKYQSPQQLYEIFINKCSYENIEQKLNILDLGCGTGLAGEAFADVAETITGIDISKNMLEIAAKKNIYTSLDVIDIKQFLQRKLCFDLIIACDTLVYFGDLSNIMQNIALNLHEKGFFVFTVEKLLSSDAKNYYLSSSGRFQHEYEYIEQLSKNFQLNLYHHEEIILRQQNQQNVAGFAFILQKYS